MKEDETWGWDFFSACFVSGGGWHGSSQYARQTTSWSRNSFEQSPALKRTHLLWMATLKRCIRNMLSEKTWCTYEHTSAQCQLYKRVSAMGFNGAALMLFLTLPSTILLQAILYFRILFCDKNCQKLAGKCTLSLSNWPLQQPKAPKGVGFL